MRVEANDQAKSYEAAMLRKIKDAQELEGEAANRLIREAAPPEEARKPASPPGTGRLVDTTAEFSEGAPMIHGARRAPGVSFGSPPPAAPRAPG